MTSPEVGYSSLGILPGAQGLGAAFAVNLDGPLRREADLGGRNIGLGIARFIGPAAVATVVAAAVGASVAVIGATVKQAGALEQSMGALDSVFRESAGQMHASARTAATAVGLTRDQYSSLGVLVGSQLKNLGTSMDDLAPRTDAIIRHGADMASMFGGSTQEAVEALSSALKGEMDPLERYGVSLTSARIEARIAEDAARGVTYASEDQAKAAATLALIFEQSADAEGNFARESATYEGTVQRLGASWANVTTTIGQGFLPIATAGGSLLLAAMPDVQTMAAHFAELAPAVQGLVGLLTSGDYNGALLAPFGITEDSGVVDLLLSVREAIFDVFTSGDPTALAGLFGDLVIGVANALASYATTVYPILMDVVPKALDWYLNIYAPAVLMFEVALLGSVIEVLPRLTLAFWEAFPAIFAAMLGMLPGPLAAALTLFSGLVDALVTAIPLVVAALVQMLPAIASALAGMLPSLVTGALELFMGILEGRLAMHPVLLDAVLELLPLLVTSLAGMLPSIIDSALTLLLGIVTGLLTAIPQVLIALLGMLPSLISSLVSLIPLVLRSAVDLFKSLVSANPEVLPSLVGALVQVGPALVGVIGGLVGVLVHAGIDLVAGLVRGLLDSAGGVVDMLLNLASGAVDAFKDFFGIKSPSRLLMGVGGAMGDSLVEELDRGDLASLAPLLSAGDRVTEQAGDGVEGAAARLGAARRASETPPKVLSLYDQNGDLVAHLPVAA